MLSGDKPDGIHGLVVRIMAKVVYQYTNVEINPARFKRQAAEVKPSLWK